MKKFILLIVAMLYTLIIAGTGNAELGGQVFYKYGTANLKDDRGGQAFTDTLGLMGTNDGDSGSAIAAGLDVPLSKIFGNTLLGEVAVEYARFSDKTVLQTASVLVDEATNAAESGTSYDTSSVNVSELNVVIAPKYRFELGKLRPWIIPVGLAFLVNSPPSNDATYLDTGYHYGAGVEYMIADQLSLGVDYRNTIASGNTGFKATYSSFGVYVGINF
ncbi:MAG: hypothetical protein A2132_00175 [Nitrospirae bacterium RBG_16_43_11]|nr:MAG: hypothetical protein A2132_00175 [Nitrospirae bacterium RBG_16_43_11]